VTVSSGNVWLQSRADGLSFATHVSLIVRHTHLPAHVQPSGQGARLLRWPAGMTASRTLMFCPRRIGNTGMATSSPEGEPAASPAGSRGWGGGASFCDPALVVTRRSSSSEWLGYQQEHSRLLHQRACAGAAAGWPTRSSAPCCPQSPGSIRPCCCCAAVRGPGGPTGRCNDACQLLQEPPAPPSYRHATRTHVCVCRHTGALVISSVMQCCTCAHIVPCHHHDAYAWIRLLIATLGITPELALPLPFHDVSSTTWLVHGSVLCGTATT
jgi:hypothetical protein